MTDKNWEALLGKWPDAVTERTNARQHLSASRANLFMAKDNYHKAERKLDKIETKIAKTLKKTLKGGIKDDTGK